MSTLRANQITDVVGTGSPEFPNGLKLNTNAVLGPVTGDAPMYACRAWVNFNGTGTVAIRASGNVSSITDNGTGDYTVNFTTAMPDANYVTTFGYSADGSFNSWGYVNSAGRTPNAPTTSAVRIGIRNTSDAALDVPYLNVAIFR